MDNSTPGTSGTQSQNSVFREREEYLQRLREWIEQAKLWHTICVGFPQYCNQLHLNSAAQNTSIFTSSEQQRLQGVGPFSPNVYIPQQQVGTVPQVARQADIAAALQRGIYEFAIPPLWKRFVAEILDFIILFIIKLLLTFIVLESFGFLNVERSFEALQKNFQNPKVAMHMSVEILVLEVVHRILVCCYEVYWLKGGQCATPGKWYMGLMVIHADIIVAVANRPEGIVRVLPSTPLGFQKAFIRAILKNLFIGLMLPICFALYVFRFNRTGYDIIANSLVVEWNHNLPFRPVD